MSLDTPLTPSTFMDQVHAAAPGWSDELGGPLGVAQLCSDLQAQVNELSEAIASVRASAIHELLKTHSGADVARTLGVSRAAISKIASRRSETLPGDLPW